MKNIFMKNIAGPVLTFSKIFAISTLVLAFVIPMLAPVNVEASMLTETLKVLSGQHFHDTETVTETKTVYVAAPTVIASVYPISGYCYANSSSANTNDVVTWSVYASGGNGNYSYSWTGTDGLSGNFDSVSKVYYSTGSKNASVTIYSSGASSRVVNCSSNIIIYNDSNNNNSDLNISCSASDTSIDTNDNITWRASVSGGNGNYNYDWNGTDGLSSSNSSVSKTYYSEGTKYASLTVTSGNQTVSHDCNNSVYVSDYNDNNDNNDSSLHVSCRPSDTSIETGDRLTWRATVSGGNGNYDYDWEGTDNLSGSNSSVNKTYSYGGTKYATVTVYSGGHTTTEDCNNSVYVDDNYNYNSNNYSNNSNLNVTCSANLSAGISGNTVTWTAYPTGGNGYYTYAWSGTDDLLGYNSAIAKTYWLLGNKTATITISSGNQTISRQCVNTLSISARPVSFATTAVTGGDYPPAKTVATVPNTDLTISCSPNTNNSKINDTVVWISDVKGGNGKYVYQWDGSDNLKGDMNYLAKNYSSNGEKTAVLTVTSNNKTVTKICGALIVGDNSQTASAFFGNMTGTFIIVLLFAIIAFLGVIMYFLNIRDRGLVFNRIPPQL